MAWTLRGAHLLLQTRTKVLNDELARCSGAGTRNSDRNHKRRNQRKRRRDPRTSDALLKYNGTPRIITLDAYAASHRAVADLKAEGKVPKRVRVRSSKYLNNGIEQDRRRIKQRIHPTLGFKRVHTAAVTISGIELAAKIRKHQFKIGLLSGRPTTMPEIWTAVLAA